MNKPYRNKEWLRQKYEVECLSIREIARLCGVSHNLIWMYLQRFNIKRRKLEDYAKIKKQKRKVEDVLEELKEINEDELNIDNLL